MEIDATKSFSVSALISSSVLFVFVLLVFLLFGNNTSIFFYFSVPDHGSKFEHTTIFSVPFVELQTKAITTSSHGQKQHTNLDSSTPSDINGSNLINASNRFRNRTVSSR